MRNAPSVAFPAGRLPWEGAALTLVSVAAAVLWGFAAPAWTSGVAAAGAVGSALWGCLAWGAWRRSPGGRLAWDAQAPASGSDRSGAWFWFDAVGALGGRPVRSVRVALDAQTWVLVRLSLGGAGGVRWLVFQRQDDPGWWADWRRALVAHASVRGNPEGDAPSGIVPRA